MSVDAKERPAALAGAASCTVCFVHTTAEDKENLLRPQLAGRQQTVF